MFDSSDCIRFSFRLFFVGGCEFFRSGLFDLGGFGYQRVRDDAPYRIREKLVELSGIEPLASTLPVLFDSSLTFCL